MSAKLAMVGGGQVFPVKKKKIADLAMRRHETLALPGRLEAPPYAVRVVAREDVNFRRGY